jgi:NAD-dependent dihydropyrimidine dehydrogenase PreA subunit
MNKSTADCKQEPGVFAPIIDRNKCEGKADCVKVCPYAVFTMGILPKEERADLALIGKIKGFGHGWEQSFATNVGGCRACGLCVQSCPEKAITLNNTFAN